MDCFRKGGVKDTCDPFFTTVIILFFAFSLAAVTVAFFAYRVFKAMAYGQLGMQGGNNYNAFMRGANRREERDEEQNPSSYQPPSQAASAN